MEALADVLEDAPTLEARDVVVRVADRTLLERTTLAVEAGALVAVIGPSGAGKSTLLRALAGVRRPTSGQVLLGGAPVRDQPGAVGYVPAGTLAHPELTAFEAVRYAARLRLPRATDADLDARAREVLEQLEMADRADVRIAQLSDGQRRRVACGIELVGRPDALVLDEPAAGLDAVLERRLMLLLRRLADAGRAVVLATHATSSLGLCDRVAVVASGGDLRFVGTPDELLERFGVGSFDEVYLALDEDGAGEQPAGAPEEAPPAEPLAAASPASLAPFGTQVGALASRYATCVARNRRLLALLLGQAPIIGIAIALVVPQDTLDQPGIGSFFSVMLAFLLLTGALWLGLISACREVVRERAILDRELAVGVRIDAYLAAKVAVLGPLVLAQVVLLAVPVLLAHPQDLGPGRLAGVVLVCAALGLAAAAGGLWLSTAVRSSDQATSSVPLVLIPQLLLAGAIIPLSRMSPPLEAVSTLAASRWALTGIGSSMGLDGRLSQDLAEVTGFDAESFALPAGVAVLVLLGFGAVFLLFAASRLARDVDRG